jgi:hypothetical protein
MVDEVQKKFPLDLPEGSVRALLALILVLSTFVLFLLNKTPPEWYLSLVMMVIAFYFGIRTNGQ